MDKEYPDQGAGDETISAERAMVSLPPTGDPRVDEVVAGLARLPGRPAVEHVSVLEEVHGQLRDILDELNDDPAKGQP